MSKVINIRTEDALGSPLACLNCGYDWSDWNHWCAVRDETVIDQYGRPLTCRNCAKVKASIDASTISPDR